MQVQISHRIVIVGSILIVVLALLSVVMSSIYAAETQIGSSAKITGRTSSNLRGCWANVSGGQTLLALDCDNLENNNGQLSYSVCGGATGVAYQCTDQFDADGDGNADASYNGKVLNCDSCGWGDAPLPGCTAENYGKECTYSNCDASTGKGTKTCKLNDGVSCSGGVGNGSTYAHPGTFNCPACSASQESCTPQYNCTGKSTNGITKGKKKNVCTSSTCKPTQNAEEDCSVCNDDTYTNCGWPTTCSSSEFAAGKVVRQCKVPDNSQCKPTNSGSAAFVEDATRQKEKSCCKKDVADSSSPTHYSKSYSSCTAPTCSSSKIQTTCSSAASGISCIPESTPLTIVIASSCKDCTIGITDDGATKGAYTNNCSVIPLSGENVAACNTRANKYTLRCGATDITCSESTHDFHPACIDCLTATDVSTTNAGASKGTYTSCVAGNSCNATDNTYELTCASTDGKCKNKSHIFKPNCPDCTYNTGSSCTDQKECDPTTITPTSNKTTWRCTKTSDNPSYCKGASEITEQRNCGLCVEDDLYTCTWSGCADGVKTRTCTKKSGLRKGAPNCVLSVPDCSDADCSNKFGKRQTTSTGCGGAPPDSGLPRGDTGSTMINIGGSWLGSTFLFHAYEGTDRRIGIGTVSPSETLEISDASNTDATTRLRISDYNHNPEMQLQYGIDNVFQSPKIKHWSMYVKNIKGSGETTEPDKSLRIWGNDADRVIIDKDGNLHAAKFCSNMDTASCTEVTGGGASLTDQGFNNLIMNGGFESGDTRGWKVSPFVNSIKSGVTKDQPHSGENSFKMTGTTTSFCTGGSIVQYIPVKKNTKYSLGAWVKPSNNNHIVSAQITGCAEKDKSNTCTSERGYKLGKVEKASDWKRILVQDFDSKDNEEVQVYFEVRGDCDNVVYVDDILFIEGSSAIVFSEPYLNSGGTQYILGKLGIGRQDPESTLHISSGQPWGSDISLDARGIKNKNGVYEGSRWLFISTGGKKDSDNQDRADEGSGSLLIKDTHVNAGVRISVDSVGRVGMGSIRPTARLDLHNKAFNPRTKIYSAEGNILKGVQFASTFDQEMSPGDLIDVRRDNQVGTQYYLARGIVKEVKNNYEVEIEYTGGSAQLVNDYARSGGAITTIIPQDILKITSTDGKIILISKENGNVGFGTTAPASALHITGSTGLTLGEDKASDVANTAGTLRLISAGDNAFSTSFVAGTQTANATYTLPTASANGLLKNTSGALSWDGTTYLTTLKTQRFNNLIINGGFESGKMEGATSIVSKVVTEQVHSGKYGYKFSANSDNGDLLEYAIPVKKNTPYSLSFWIKTVGTTGRAGSVTISFCTGTESSTCRSSSDDTRSFDSTTTNNWKEFVRENIDSKDNSYIRALFSTYNDSGTVFLDDVSFVEGPSAIVFDEHFLGDSGNQYVLGNVGIGTTAPASALHITGSTGLTLGEDKTSGADVAGKITFISTSDTKTTFTTGAQSNDIDYILPVVSANGLLKNTVTGTSNALSWDTTTYLTTAITKLNGLTDTEQLFAKTDDTNVTLSITSASASSKGTHTFALGWNGILGADRGGLGLALTSSAPGTAGNLLRVKAGGTAWEMFPPDYISKPATTDNGFLKSTAGVLSWAGEADPKVGSLTTGYLPKWIAATGSAIAQLSNSKIFEDANGVGIGTLKPTSLLTITGTGQNPEGTPSACQAGTLHFDENGNTTIDSGECKPAILFNTNGTLTITQGAGAGKVLISDAAGKATWQPPKFMPDGTAQGQTLWWDNTAAAKKWIADNKLTITSDGNVGIGAVAADEFAVSRFVVKGDDANKKNGMYVSFQDDNTIISTTPYPRNASGIMISVDGPGALNVDSTTKKLTIVYTISNLGQKSLTNIEVFDPACGQVNKIPTATDTTKNIGDVRNFDILDGMVETNSGSPTSPEFWKFTCTTSEITQSVEGTATVTAKEGSNDVRETAKWKATVTTREVAASSFERTITMADNKLIENSAMTKTKVLEAQIDTHGCSVSQKWCVSDYDTAGGSCIPKNEVCWGAVRKGEAECKSYYGKWCAMGTWCNATEGSMCGDEKVDVCEKEGGYWDKTSSWPYCATRSYVFVSTQQICESPLLKEAGRIWCQEDKTCTNSGKICNYASTASDCATRTNAEWCPSYDWPSGLPSQNGECVQKGWCTRLSETACKTANRTWCPYPDGGGKCAISGRDCFGKVIP